jgi:hypothetical protein
LSTMAQQARPGFWPGFTGPGPGRAGRPVWPSLAGRQDGRGRSGRVPMADLDLVPFGSVYSQPGSGSSSKKRTIRGGGSLYNIIRSSNLRWLILIVDAAYYYYYFLLAPNDALQLCCLFQRTLTTKLQSASASFNNFMIGFFFLRL